MCTLRKVVHDYQHDLLFENEISNVKTLNQDGIYHILCEHVILFYHSFMCPAFRSYIPKRIRSHCYAWNENKVVPLHNGHFVTDFELIVPRNPINNQSFNFMY